MAGRWAARASSGSTNPGGETDCVPKVVLAPYLHPSELTAQRLGALARGVGLGVVSVDHVRTLPFRIPAAVLAGQGPVRITFLHPDAAAPAAHGHPDDQRVLGFSFRSLRLSHAPAAAAPRGISGTGGVTAADIGGLIGLPAAQFMLRGGAAGPAAFLQHHARPAAARAECRIRRTRRAGTHGVLARGRQQARIHAARPLVRAGVPHLPASGRRGGGRSDRPAGHQAQVPAPQAARRPGQRGQDFCRQAQRPADPGGSADGAAPARQAGAAASWCPRARSIRRAPRSRPRTACCTAISTASPRPTGCRSCRWNPGWRCA